MLFFLSLAILCLLNNLALAQPYSYKFQYLTVDDGLSHTDANDITQDKLGYIWIATHFGLNRYDGYSVKKFYNRNVPLHNAFKNRIRCISTDEKGDIWLGTENGLQRFNARIETFTDFDEGQKINLVFEKLVKPAGEELYSLAGRQLKLFIVNGNSIQDQNIALPPDVQFSDMALGQNGMLYLSSNKGLWTLDKNRNFAHVSVQGLADQPLSLVDFDKQHNLLTATCHKLFIVTKDLGSKQSDAAGVLVVKKQFDVIFGSCIKAIAQGNKSDYWIITSEDLLRLDVLTGTVQVANDKNSAHSLNSQSTVRVFVDRSECLWVCTYGGGLNYCDLNEKLFYTLQHNPKISNTLSGNHIRSVLEDGDSLWIGTTISGLNLYNFKTQKFELYHTGSPLIKLKDDKITALTFDSDHNLWIGSSPGIEILRRDGKGFYKPPGYDKFPAHQIETLVKDCYGNIWFGNHKDKFGVIWKDKKNVYQVKYYGEGYFIFADKKNPLVFVSSTQGLQQLFIDADGNVTKSIFYKASSKPNSLSSNYTYPVSQQNDSTYWIGTIGGGLNRLLLHLKNNSYEIKSFGETFGVFNDVESVELDNAGNIWMGGYGLECLNPTTGKLVRYDKNDGLQGNSFKTGSSYKGASGRLYFGGINGLNYFYPDQIKSNHIDAKPVLTDILINNQKPQYKASAGNSILQAIGYSGDLELSYLQNNFVISFSSMHFANPLKCHYRYKLTGFDKDWKYTDGSKPNAAYSNLDYTSYKFVVEATNNDGSWSKTQAVTSVTITPPWWKSAIAKIVYALLILSALLGIYIYQARWYRLKREFEVREVNEKKKEEIHKEREEIYQQQLTFFTNISHEFRTPLSLILGPLESLISQNKNDSLNNSYQLMYRNTKRLINLISELMNFRKVADKVIKLQVRPLMISQFCKDLAAEFKGLATSKDISFNVIDRTKQLITESTTGFFDIKVLEKILYNLLNNAFKYTDEGGEILFEILFDITREKTTYQTGFQLLNEKVRAEHYIYFRVTDSGIGISDDSITHIFDRYYRVSNDHLGSGVGLAMVKSLTELHKGDIYVYSERNKGTEITIGIPWGEQYYDDSEKQAYPYDLESHLENIDNGIDLPVSYQGSNEPATTKIQKHILLVDDNKELRVFIKQALENYYFIHEAGDGNSALEVAREKIPDLIISDVMMPGMNGMEFCKKIKDTFETSHVPFIILSAKEALASKIEGMESGADYYFAKPLSVDLLLLTIHNIFEQDKRLKVKYAKNYLSDATELVHSEKDKEFFQKMLNIIEENIQNMDMDVDFLCEHLYISRTKLYQKIKSISDQSVGEFIRTIRLKRAIQIMTHEVVSMNEVADRIGLQSSSNFSRVFKKEYGQSPLQFIQSLKKNPAN